MKIALFSQSLFALPLTEAIEATASLGFDAIELACTAPHFDYAHAQKASGEVAQRIAEAGLSMAALSLFNQFTGEEHFDRQVAEAKTYIRLAPQFGTRLLKLTPGAPASDEATPQHWDLLAKALELLIPVAREANVSLAFETHMRQLTDTLASSKRLLEMTPPDTVGLTVDFSNLSFAGEDMRAAIPALADRIFHTHVKNGVIDKEGGWQFDALDQGLTDYPTVLALLRNAGYKGYLSIECLGSGAQTHPRETARRDLAILRGMLEAQG